MVCGPRGPTEPEVSYLLLTEREERKDAAGRDEARRLPLATQAAAVLVVSIAANAEDAHGALRQRLRLLGLGEQPQVGARVPRCEGG